MGWVWVSMWTWGWAVQSCVIYFSTLIKLAFILRSWKFRLRFHKAPCNQVHKLLKLSVVKHSYLLGWGWRIIVETQRWISDAKTKWKTKTVTRKGLCQVVTWSSIPLIPVLPASLTPRWLMDSSTWAAEQQIAAGNSNVSRMPSGWLDG